MPIQCEDIQLSMPWLVNGTLAPHERVEMYRHLSVCSTCRVELSIYLFLQDAFEQEKERTPISTMDEEQLFKSIMSKIDQMENDGTITKRSPGVDVETKDQKVLSLLRDTYAKEWEQVRGTVQPAVEELRTFARIVRKVISLAS